jgi:hypothetical protein
MKRMIVIALSFMFGSVLSYTPPPLASAEPASPARGSAHEQPSSPVARLVLRDGTCRLVRLEGVGCFESICSRVAVRNRSVGDMTANLTPFDMISGMKDMTDDEALFVLNDGSTRRVSINRDNRVLYIANPDGRHEKIEFRDVKSLDFVRSDQQ